MPEVVISLMGTAIAALFAALIRYVTKLESKVDRYEEAMQKQLESYRERERQEAAWWREKQMKEGGAVQIPSHLEERS